ncbi:hypothetical protein CHS0354_036274 [Potamilus streckersoni]|uniref:Uncharacterized protein n=1 Tax=Potamilus streckersoni TaxID=2493646 RepID=A0AAE0W8V8_9BIVA|nr:hypothetical protein CHS0354_036274 [Potamilus streckersoni]
MPRLKLRQKLRHKPTHTDEEKDDEDVTTEDTKMHVPVQRYTKLGVDAVKNVAWRILKTRKTRKLRQARCIAHPL